MVTRNPQASSCRTCRRTARSAAFVKVVRPKFVVRAPIAHDVVRGELVSKDDDLQVQRRAGANEKAQRVKQRDDDRRHESRLSEDVGNLNRHNVYGVFNRHSTKGETPATAKELPTDYRASSRLYRNLVCTQNASRSNRLSKYTCRPRASAHALHAT